VKLSRIISDSSLNAVNRLLGRCRLVMLKKRPYGPYVIDIWNFDNKFEEIYTKIKNVVGVTKRSLFIIYQTLIQVSSITGDVAECGVYKGGSASLIAQTINKLAPRKGIHLFDTFKGLPDPNFNYDSSHGQGMFQDTSVESVRALLSGLDNVNIQQGLFQETFPSIADNTFCFVHIDCDIYESILYCCQFFYPRLNQGGIMIFDDYGYTIDWPGAKRAVDDFFRDKREKPIHLPTGQGFVIKL
jgi:hypothetical protein